MPTNINGNTGIDKVQDGTVVSADIATLDASKLTGSIAAARIANNTIDSAHIASGAVDNAHISGIAATKLTGTIADARFPSTLPAASAANLTAIPAANITGTLPAISGANLTGLPAGGLSEADQWRMHSGFTSPDNGVSDITNWERPDTGGGGGYVGTGMSQSSGVWTFPSTGQYLIDFHITGSSTADVRYIRALINTTTNNGSAWYVAADGRTSLNPESSWWYTGARVTFLFDVTNVSTHKVKLSAGGENNNLSINGASNANETYVTFLKLGET